MPLQGALDRLEYLTTTQIRRLYEILTTLALTKQSGGSPVQDEIRILIRKQLLHSEQRCVHVCVCV